MGLTVAQVYPAIQQPNGTIWYRGGMGEGAGWSPSIEHAHPSYMAPDAPPVRQWSDPQPWVLNAELDAVAIAAPPAIEAFRGQYEFLSNFARLPAVYATVEYPTAEHAYQAAKTLDAREREKIRKAPTPAEAKRLGRRVTLCFNWNGIRDDVMLTILLTKFALNLEARTWLLATGNANLIEGNTWHDNYWGNCTCAPCISSNGFNRLGQLLMAVREQLRHEPAPAVDPQSATLGPTAAKRACEHCWGEQHPPLDRLTFSGRCRRWLCAHCWQVAYDDQRQPAPMEQIREADAERPAVTIKRGDVHWPTLEAEATAAADIAKNVVITSPDSTQEGTPQPVTEIAADGTIHVRPRTTQWAEFPLPPDLPGRFKPVYNSVKQYTLPHPQTGRETAFSRATTIAETLDDTYNLDRWDLRETVSAVLEGVRLQMDLADSTKAHEMQLAGELTPRRMQLHNAMGPLWTEPRTNQKYNQLIETVRNLSGGAEAREFGEAIHAWCAAVDVGIIRPADVPDMFKAHVEAYRTLLRQHALLPIPDYVERIIFNDDNGLIVRDATTGQPQQLSTGEAVVGTLDRLFWVLTSAELALGDLKTSKAESLSWAVFEFCVQLAVYRFARLMLALDGKSWGPMPILKNDTTAYLMHLPSDDPKRSCCLAINVGFGSEAMKVAIYVRDLRRRAKREGLIGTIPIPSPQALQWAAARHAIQDVSSPAELAGIFEQYREVWTDDLTTLGRQVAGLFT